MHEGLCGKWKKNLKSYNWKKIQIAQFPEFQCALQLLWENLWPLCGEHPINDLEALGRFDGSGWIRMMLQMSNQSGPGPRTIREGNMDANPVWFKAVSFKSWSWRQPVTGPTSTPLSLNLLFISSPLPLFEPLRYLSLASHPIAWGPLLYPSFFLSSPTPPPDFLEAFISSFSLLPSLCCTWG